MIVVKSTFNIGNGEKEMSVSLISIKCPECGASLEIDRERKECFCSYCGNKLIIDDGSRTITHVYIDRTREKELEIQQNNRIVDNRIKIAAAAVIGMAILFVMITFVLLHDDFNITFNYALLLIGAGFAAKRIGNKNLLAIGGIISLILIASSIAFIVLKSDFNATFTMTIAVVLVLHGVVSITRNIMN